MNTMTKIKIIGIIWVLLSLTSVILWFSFCGVDLITLFPDFSHKFFLKHAEAIIITSLVAFVSGLALSFVNIIILMRSSTKKDNATGGTGQISDNNNIEIRND